MAEVQIGHRTWKCRDPASPKTWGAENKLIWDANNGGKQDNDLQEFRPREGAKLPGGLTGGLFFARM